MRPSRFVWAAMVALAIGSLAGCSSSAGGSSRGLVSTTVPRGFVGAALLPTAMQSANSISCPSVSTCVVVGTAAAYTNDAGASWHVGTLPTAITQSGHVNLGPVSCPTSQVCVAAGGGPNGSYILYSTDGGGSWSEGSLSTGEGLSGLFCRTPGFCVGVVAGGPAEISSDGGAMWSSGQPISSPSFLDAVSCPTTMNCVAVAGYDTTTGSSGAVFSSDGGQDWTAGAVPPGVHDFEGLSCQSVADCVAVGSNAINNCGPSGCAQLGSSSSAIALTSDGGNTWTMASAPSGSGELYDVSCPSATACVAVGAASQAGPALLYSTNGGSSWSFGSVNGKGSASNAAQSVSCPSATECVAVGSADSSLGTSTIFFTVDSGKKWTFNAALS